MTAWLLLLGAAFVSSFVPVVNIEAYLAVHQQVTHSSIFIGSAVAALGQMIGKAVWFEAGAKLTAVPWLAKKLESPKWLAQREKWRDRLAGRPWLTGLTLFASAASGIPPYAVMAVVAGDLRVNRLVFWVSGLLGRFVRFLVFLGLFDQVMTWIR